MVERKSDASELPKLETVGALPRIEDGVVVLPGGERKEFPIKVVQLVQIDDVLIVRGEGTARYAPANLWGMDTMGHVLWQVTDWPPLDNEFTELAFRDGKLIAFNFNGYRCELNPRTGYVTNVVFTK
jgi:hypothetical protein